MTNERTYQIIIGVLVFIIVIGGWFAFGRKASITQGTAEQATVSESTGGTSSGAMNAPSDTSAGSVGSGVSASSGATSAAAGDAVSVADQAAGMNVAVQSVTLGQAGWVAVRDADHILGAGWFPAGAHAAVSVPLLRATVAGQRYQVLLYADDGDKAFDFHKDTLITSSDGSVAGTTFTAN